jgi:hypothetical protein
MAPKHKPVPQKPSGLNRNYNPRKLEFKLFDERLHLNPAFPTMWLSPLEFRFRNIGYTQLIQIIGKNIDINDRKNFLLQTPPEKSEKPSKYSLFTEFTPDFFTKQEQISVGIKGGGFKNNGLVSIQATAEHPRSNYYTGFQINLVPGDIPLVILHRKYKYISITPQLGIDLQSGVLSPSAKINFENSILKSLNFQINNLSFDWKKKFADTSTVMAEFAF